MQFHNEPLHIFNSEGKFIKGLIASLAAKHNKTPII